jgi:hypothetical protein
MGLRPDHGIVEYRTMMMFLAAWKTGTTPLTILTFSLFVASDVCGASALEKNRPSAENCTKEMERVSCPWSA